MGVGWGGGIFTGAGNFTGEPAQLTLENVTLRHNRAVGGDGNAAGTYPGAGWGGGLASSGHNSIVSTSGGSTTVVLHSTIAFNQAVGGAGGEAQGGGAANHFGGFFLVEDSTLAHNLAQAGAGGTGSGGGLYNGAASVHPSNLGAPTVLVVEGSTITLNTALGDAAGAGGGLWSGGTTSVLDSAITSNRALGGEAAGSGYGGGVYNAGPSSLHLGGCTVRGNHANGGEGGTGGEGVGGGVYNLGLFDFDADTLILKNYASTSHDDFFDPLV